MHAAQRQQPYRFVRQADFLGPWCLCRSFLRPQRGGITGKVGIVGTDKVESAASGGGKKPTGKSANDVLISHADRLWNSATQNAARIAQRVQILGGGIVVLLGLSYSSVGWLTNAPTLMTYHAWFMSIIMVLFIIAIIFFGKALAHLYIRGDSSGMAADLMEMDKSDLGPTKTIVFRKT